MKKGWISAFLYGVILAVGADMFLLRQEHPDPFLWSHIPGFFAFYGFLGFLILVAFAKFLGHAWLQRRENYYDDGDR